MFTLALLILKSVASNLFYEKCKRVHLSLYRRRPTPLLIWTVVNRLHWPPEQTGHPHNKWWIVPLNCSDLTADLDSVPDGREVPFTASRCCVKHLSMSRVTQARTTWDHQHVHQPHVSPHWSRVKLKAPADRQRHLTCPTCEATKA